MFVVEVVIGKWCVKTVFSVGKTTNGVKLGMQQLIRYLTNIPRAIY